MAKRRRTAGEAAVARMSDSERRQYRRWWQERLEDHKQVAEEEREARRELDAFLTVNRLPTPSTIEDMENLARIIGLPFDVIRSGDYTAREVYEYAFAWVARQASAADIHARVAKKTQPSLSEIQQAILNVVRNHPRPMRNAEDIATATRVYYADSRFRGEVATLRRLGLIDKREGRYVAGMS